MNRDTIKKFFGLIGSRITIRNLNPDPLAEPRARFNVSNDSKGEHFTLSILGDENRIEVTILDVNKKLKHILLLIKYTISPRIITTERLLCGHDEMHWFVAGVTNSVSIKQAFERLRPDAVTVAFNQSGEKNKNRNRRKNKGFIRQGEWFFVPVDFKEKESTIIHKNEPINRRGGTSHIVEELIRIGGETVYVNGDNVLSKREYNKLDKNQRLIFKERTSNARVLARGKVKHRDHHTIELKGWHSVHLSTESGTSSNAFID